MQGGHLEQIGVVICYLGSPRRLRRGTKALQIELVPLELPWSSDRTEVQSFAKSSGNLLVESTRHHVRSGQSSHGLRRNS